MSSLLAVTNASNSKTYVDDVFSAYTYTGNGSTQTITNGIDLSTNGGLVWIKNRSQIVGHYLFDTARGPRYDLSTNSTAAQDTGGGATEELYSFNSSGFSVGATYNANVNVASNTYVSWTFRKALKFFDVVTYTGDGVAGRTVAHSLGQSVGMLVIKRTDTVSSWFVWHNGLANTEYLTLETTNAKATATGYWNSTTPTSTGFTLGSSSTNINGATYVAYLFAHDASTDGLIQCGSYTGSTTVDVTVDLGFEPQFLLIKNASAAADWMLLDTTRQLTIDAGSVSVSPNLSTAEASWSGAYIRLTNRGFTVKPGWTQFSVAGQTFIYLAIRRPNKPPTTGTQVYNAIARTGTSAAATVTGVGFAPDLVITGGRNWSSNHTPFFDRLRGATKRLFVEGSAAVGLVEVNNTSGLTSFNMDGVSLGSDSDGAPNGSSINTSTVDHIHWNFRRAPGVFDVVCYTGNSSTVPGGDVSISHSLGVAPEMAIVKIRDIAGDWAVGHSSDWTRTLVLDSTSAAFTGASNQAFTAPTSTVLNVRNNNVSSLNSNAHTYVAYLFASKAGISKVGSYTGNGSSQTINCGFTTGARFVLIKRTDSTGDWFVWDTVRGIVASTDPHLSLNTTAAEVTTDDSIDPDTTGFVVNQVAATNVNVTSATYIFLAFA